MYKPIMKILCSSLMLLVAPCIQGAVECTAYRLTPLSIGSLKTGRAIPSSMPKKIVFKHLASKASFEGWLFLEQGQSQFKMNAHLTCHTEDCVLAGFISEYNQKHEKLQTYPSFEATLTTSAVVTIRDDYQVRIQCQKSPQ
jgi:hypothetical protein